MLYNFDLVSNALQLLNADTCASTTYKHRIHHLCTDVMLPFYCVCDLNKLVRDDIRASTPLVTPMLTIGNAAMLYLQPIAQCDAPGTGQ